MKTDSLPFINSQLFWYIFLSESKSYFMTLSASSLIMISMLPFFECISRSLSLSMIEINAFAIVNWITHVSYFFRLFMMSFKYGLTLLRYPLTDSVLSLSFLLLYSI